jgi:nicotinamide mononucleotide transporter
MEIARQIIQQALALGWVDWVVAVTALIYVALAARENVWCWFWGIISCALWAYASFFYYDLWLDALLQLFYVGMGFLGIYRWKYGDQKQADLPVSRMTWEQHLLIAVGGFIIALAFGYLFDEYTPAAATYLDAVTTVFAVITTFLLVQKKLENWLYWIAIDAAYVYLYSSRGALLFALLMAIYVVIAVFGYYSWRKGGSSSGQ